MWGNLSGVCITQHARVNALVLTKLLWARGEHWVSLGKDRWEVSPHLVRKSETNPQLNHPVKRG